MLTAAGPQNSVEEQHDLMDKIKAARVQTDQLFELVQPEALYERPIAERHRIIFYRGHLEAFDWNLLQPHLAGLKAFDAGLDHLFAFGIDPVDGQLPSDQPSDWPSRPQVEAYVDRSRALLDAALRDGGLPQEDGQETPRTLLNVALEHRLMHAETLAYMLHRVPPAQKRSVAQVEAPACPAPVPKMIRIPAGKATLGLDRDGSSFGWDNEFDRHMAGVAEFSIDRFKVTNGQYLEFVLTGGYHARELWTAEGWNWIRQEQIAHPAFWKQDGSQWRYRGMFEEVPLPLDWPVYVSQAEAAAYARWSGKRLPTEAEWHRAAYGVFPGEPEGEFPWGDERPAPQHGFFSGRRWDPWPVNAFPAGAGALGVEGLLANGWEWTSTPFAPFDGFRAFPFYPGYSANFFDGKHYVMKGGSTRTAASMLRRSFRNWFQPHYPFVYAGFRCACG